MRWGERRQFGTECRLRLILGDKAVNHGAQLVGEPGVGHTESCRLVTTRFVGILRRLGLVRARCLNRLSG
jgi:hypothetical protein